MDRVWRKTTRFAFTQLADLTGLDKLFQHLVINMWVCRTSALIYYNLAFPSRYVCSRLYMTYVFFFPLKFIR